MNVSELFVPWEQIRNGLVQVIDSFDEEELVYKPFAESWSVAEIVLHIADAEEGWIRYVVKGELSEWPTHYTTVNYGTRAAIKGVLQSVHDGTKAYLETLELPDLEQEFEAPWGTSYSLYWIIWHVVEHEIHHRGELSLVLGLLGKKGPDI